MFDIYNDESTHNDFSRIVIVQLPNADEKDVANGDTEKGAEGNGSTDKPKELPYELSTPTAMRYWKKLLDGGLVDEHWQRTEKMTLSAAGYAVFCFAKVLNIEGGWSMFEDFWECNNLRQEYEKIKYKPTKKCEKLKLIFDL